jgi:hypothetical protein
LAKRNALAPLAAVLALSMGSLVETVLAPTIVCIGCVALLAATPEKHRDPNTTWTRASGEGEHPSELLTSLEDEGTSR